MVRSASATTRVVLLAFSVMGSAALLTGCQSCMGEPPPPVVPNAATESSGSGAAPTPDAGSTEADSGEAARPQRPTTVHAERPAASDFEVTPVVGPWATFRGNDSRSGFRNAPAITAPQVVWSQDVGIQGYANVTVVTDDALYISSQGGDHNSPPDSDARDGIVRLDPAEGELVWRYPTNRDANGMSLRGETLVVGLDGGDLLAIDRAQGVLRWQTATGCTVYHGPLVTDDAAYLVRREGIAAWSLEDGQPVQALEPCSNNDRGAISAAEDGLWAATDHRLLETFAGLDLRWAIDPPDERLGRAEVWSPPLLTKSMAVFTVHRWPFGEYTSHGATRPSVFAVWRDNGQVAWTADINETALAQETITEKNPYLRALPYIEGDRMYFTPTNRGELVWYNLSTGAREGSLTLPDCRLRQFASIVGVPGMLYLARHDGVVYGISTDGEPTIAWQLALGVHGTAATQDGFVRVPGCDVAPEDGTALFATPSIGADGTLYVPSGDGWLYAIRQSPPN